MKQKIILALFLAFIGLFTGCGPKIIQPKIESVEKVDIKGIENKVLKLEVYLNVNNPNDINLEVFNPQVEILKDSKKVADVTGNEEFNLPVGKSVAGPVKIAIPTDVLFDSVIDMFSKETEFTIKGKIYVKKLGIKFPIKFEEKKKVNLKDKAKNMLNGLLGL